MFFRINYALNKSNTRFVESLPVAGTFRKLTYVRGTMKAVIVGHGTNP